jgi:WD40 repeat protein
VSVDFTVPAANPTIASVTDRVRKFDIGRPVSSVCFLGDRAAFVGDEERVSFADAEGGVALVDVSNGAILCSASDGRRIVMGCDDGRVVALSEAGETRVVATDAKRRWIDNVAVNSDGATAWSAGKTAFVRTARGEEKALDVPTTVGGLAFSPKGFRVAVAHYNGVTLWFPNMAGTPEFLEWKGSHLGVTFSLDAKFVITSMHESALHGWRIADAKHMRMTGYPTRVRSMSWSADGKGLATSGADCVIVWPFVAKDGPMGKEPAMLGPLPTKVSAVACHPKNEILAAGYADGTILLLRLSDGAEILVRRKDGVAVTSVAWNKAGKTLAYATQGGEGGLLAL